MHPGDQKKKVLRSSGLCLRGPRPGEGPSEALTRQMDIFLKHSIASSWGFARAIRSVSGRVECSRLTGSWSSGRAIAGVMTIHRKKSSLKALSCWFPEGLRDPRSRVGSNPPSGAERGGLVLTLWLFSSSVLHEVIRTRVTPGCCGFHPSLLRAL